jgi:hypothetical protein
MRRAAVGVLLWVAGAAGLEAQTAQPPWWERLRFGGDFRWRYEGFYQRNLARRHRERFRLRVTLEAPVSDEVQIALRLASGDPADPISTNQDFSDFLTRKPVQIDQAHLRYTPRGVPGVAFGAGKFPMPVTRTQMVWDDDVNWEGTYQEVRTGGEGRLAFRAVAVQSPLNEVAAAEDSFLFAEYAQLRARFGGHTLQICLADYAIRNPDPLAAAIAAGELDTLNTNLVRRDARGRVIGFVSGFNLVDLIAEATLATPQPEYPLRLLVDWVKNTRAATNEDMGLWMVLTYGRAARPGSLAVSYTLARIEREAVLSPYVFSDMPGSNLRLHMVELSYHARSRLHFDVRPILTRRLRPEAGAPNPLLLRLQADVRVAF